jgi:hypothetical protein
LVDDRGLVVAPVLGMEVGLSLGECVYVLVGFIDSLCLGRIQEVTNHIVMRFPSKKGKREVNQTSKDVGRKGPVSASCRVLGTSEVSRSAME